ncbi:MAG: uroporphyrinogen decarboxylase family protein [Victivallales bacterium]
MDGKVKRNQDFLRNIYNKGPFKGHAFICQPNPVKRPEYPNDDYTISDRPVTDWIPEKVAYYRRQNEFMEAIGDHSVPIVQLSTGTHVYAAAFGCKVHRFVGSPPAAMPFVITADEADAVQEPDIWKSPTLYRIFELAAALRKELGPDVPFSPPDMQSGFDSAALVWNKEDFFCSMMLEPDAVKRLVAKCARLFKKFLIELRREFPNLSPAHCPSSWCPPEMGPWLSNDECGAFNEESFQEFCLPELIDLSETFGGLGMHCCAAAEHQFEYFKKIPDFYAFNRVPAGGKGFEPSVNAFGGEKGPLLSLGWMNDEPTVERLIRNSPETTRFIFHASFDGIVQAKEWFGRMSAIKK